MKNQTNSTINPSNLLQIKILSFTNNIGNAYIIPSLCSIGFLLNILCIIIFIRLSKQANLFKYFLVKTIAENSILFIGALIPLGTCVNCAVYQSLTQVIHRYIFVGYLIPVFYTYSGFCEIIITIDRILILKNKNKKSFSFKLVMVVILIFSICLFIPLLFSRRITALPENKFVLVRTSFGSSVEFPIFLTTTVLIRNTFFFVSLVLSNLLLLIQFRKYINKKYFLVSGVVNQSKSKDATSKNSSNCKISNEIKESNKRKLDDTEKRLTKMTLILSVIFILSRGLQSVGSISSSIDRANGSRFNPFTTIYSFFSNVLNYLVYSLNFFFQYYFNSLFSNELKRFFKFYS